MTSTGFLRKVRKSGIPDIITGRLANESSSAAGSCLKEVFRNRLRITGLYNSVPSTANPNTTITARKFICKPMSKPSCHFSPCTLENANAVIIVMQTKNNQKPGLVNCRNAL